MGQSLKIAGYDLDLAKTNAVPKIPEKPSFDVVG